MLEEAQAQALVRSLVTALQTRGGDVAQMGVEEVPDGLLVRGIINGCSVVCLTRPGSHSFARLADGILDKVGR